MKLRVLQPLKNPGLGTDSRHLSRRRPERPGELPRHRRSRAAGSAAAQSPSQPRGDRSRRPRPHKRPRSPPLHPHSPRSGPAAPGPAAPGKGDGSAGRGLSTRQDAAPFPSSQEAAGPGRGAARGRQQEEPPPLGV